MQMKINLSKEQEKIVNFEDGPILVKAGPGSGKTRVLIERIKRLLLSKARVKILALTFSNLAAEEMSDRIQEDPNLEEKMDNVWVGTIHSFCLDMLQTRGYLIGLSDNLVLFESLEDRKKLLSEAMLKEPRLKQILLSVDKKDQFLSNCLTMIADYKKGFVSVDSSDIESEMSLIYRAYNEQLLLQGAIDFDDILFYAYRILSENPNVVKLYNTQYRYICVDEAQDLNFAQYSVIKALCGDNFNNIMLVGDENQSIYGFNGSDSDLMSRAFVVDFKPTVFVLNENFRSAKAIVNYANTLEESSGVPNCYYEGELSAFGFDSEADEAVHVVEKILDLIRNGHPDIESNIKYEDIAVIARNKYAFQTLEASLSNAEIPYCMKKTAAGIESESEMFKVFDLELRLVANPKDILHARELQGIMNQSDNVEVLSTIHNIVQDISIDAFDLKRVLLKIKTLVNNLTTSDEEKYLLLNDCDLWLRHWVKYTAQVPSENRTLVSFRNYVSLGKTQIVENNDGVTLLTAHMSKGLQYEVVFVIGLCEGTFPDYRAVQSEKAMEQEKNNMYVAVTRAKRLCYLSYPRLKKMPWGDLKIQRPSRFITNLL